MGDRETLTQWAMPEGTPLLWVGGDGDYFVMGRVIGGVPLAVEGPLTKSGMDAALAWVRQGHIFGRGASRVITVGF